MGASQELDYRERRGERSGRDRSRSPDRGNGRHGERNCSATCRLHNDMLTVYIPSLQLETFLKDNRTRRTQMLNSYGLNDNIIHIPAQQLQEYIQGGENIWRRYGEIKQQPQFQRWLSEEGARLLVFERLYEENWEHTVGALAASLVLGLKRRGCVVLHWHTPIGASSDFPLPELIITKSLIAQLLLNYFQVAAIRGDDMFPTRLDWSQKYTFLLAYLQALVARVPDIKTIFIIVHDLKKHTRLFSFEEVKLRVELEKWGRGEVDVGKSIKVLFTQPFLGTEKYQEDELLRFKADVGGKEIDEWRPGDLMKIGSILN